jgi:type I restriction enzyme R subunit
MQTDDGKTIKALPRYQQYRAVCKAVDCLQTGKTRLQDGEKDRRGGVIWHTQGSGKSLTMSFLVRKMRTVPGLRKTKIVIVTDRTQLQDQLSKTMELAGEKVDIATRIAKARKVLSQHGPGIVCVMIQKQQDPEAKAKLKDDDIIEGKAPSFPELNADESIVLLTDEAHRSHTSLLHENLMDALPNCARIGFTGTPILMGRKKRTTEIFGEYIDVYRLADAERDEAVVPILYAGRTVKGAVRDGRDMDEVFEDMLADHTQEEMEQIKRRYATEGDVMEAEELISAKAKNMLRHYVETVLPNGFKAQVAAHSRRATLRYRAAFVKARDELVTQIENLPADTRNADPEILTNRRTKFLVRAARHLDQIKQLDFIPVISAGTTNDEKDFEPWTDPDKQQRVIDDFKNPAKPPAFLIVKSMLLTGFDAPVEQVLYLDRGMKGSGAAASYRPRQPPGGRHESREEMRLRHRLRGHHEPPHQSPQGIRGRRRRGRAQEDRDRPGSQPPRPAGSRARSLHRQQRHARYIRRSDGRLRRALGGRPATGPLRDRAEHFPVHGRLRAADAASRAFRACREAVHRDRQARPPPLPGLRRLRPKPVRREGPRADRPAHDLTRRRHHPAAHLD